MKKQILNSKIITQNNYLKNKFNLDLKIGLELEFFIVNDESNNIIMQRINKLIEASNFQYIDCCITESAKYQFEIISKPTIDIINLLKEMLIIKKLLKDFSTLNNYQIYFNNNLLPDGEDCALHVNFSFWQKNKNIFNNDFQNNIIFQKIIYGLEKNLANLIYIFNPKSCNYSKFSNSLWVAPVIGWGFKNRTTPIRVNNNRLGYYIELRPIAAESNIALVLYCLILLIIEALENNNYNLSPAIYGIAKDDQYKLKKLPTDYITAKNFFKNSNWPEILDK